MKLNSPLLLLATGMLVTNLDAQTALTWQQVKQKFEASNPTLKAAQASIAESRASEITAHLKPNPDVSLTVDGIQYTPNAGVWQPFTSSLLTPGASYLIERGNKRNLRYEAAKQSTAVTASNYLDQERSLLFNLRSAFVQTLQAKAVLQNAQENLAYWDRELNVNRTRLNAGDIAQVDFSRLQLQRFQFESDLENATVNLQTAKIQLRQLLNDNTPLERFDVTGPFDYAPRLAALQEFEGAAIETRPDLKAAYQNVEMARTNHLLAVANGSWDPTVSGWYSHNESFSNTFANNTVGGSISIPLRINDRNQGEKARTQLDIGRNESLRDATLATVLSDVETAYRTLAGVVGLLQTRETYLKLAETGRNTMRFSYLNGGASLLDYLDTEKAYRDTRLNFINLVGSYLTAAAQMNMAVGREVIL